MPFWKRKSTEPVTDPDGDLADSAARPLWDVYLAKPDRLSREQATLMDVWSTKGAVDNGGLPHFIETGGNRGRQVVDAFRAVGLEAYAVVIERTLRLYPTASASDPYERLSASSRWQDGGPEEQELDALDSKLFRMSSEGAVERAAAAFVRRHGDQFPGSTV